MKQLLILLCTILIWSCSKDTDYNSKLLDEDDLTNTEIEVRRGDRNGRYQSNELFAKYLSRTNNLMINPTDGEYLVADEWKSKGESVPTTIINAINENPLLTVSFPSLDEYPKESLDEHKNNIDFWVPLPQDLTANNVRAFAQGGEEVLISPLNIDKSKRYCVVKQSEQYYASKENELTTFSGNINPESIDYFTEYLEVADYKLYDYIQYYNALAIDNGTPRYIYSGDREPGGTIHDGPGTGTGGGGGTGGSGGTNRDPCDCDDGFERDCDEDGDETLVSCGFTHRSDTYAVETFWHGPDIELRNILTYYDAGTNVLIPVNTGIVARRRHFTGIKTIGKRLLDEWDPEVNGDRMLSHWVEEQKGNGFLLNVSISPKLRVGGLFDVSVGTVNLGINLSDVNYDLGNSLIFYQDPYCNINSRYKVWFGNKGHFFFDQGRGN